MGMLKDVISVVADNNTNINYANCKSRNKVGIIELGIELDNMETLRKVMNALQSLPEVHSVRRIQTSFNQAPQQFAKKNYKQGRRGTKATPATPKRKKTEE
jgi:uncharacterized protein with ACT and thioredoxin-like domain